MCRAGPLVIPWRLHGRLAMAETDASLLRQFPLLLPQNRAKTVYEGFISAQVPARLLPSCWESLRFFRRAALSPDVCDWRFRVPRLVGMEKGDA